MKSIAILSGGMDSTTLVYELVNQGDKVFCLSFNYGQRHKKELEYAKKTTRKLSLEHKIVDISNIHKVVQSQNSLTGVKEVPEGHYEDVTMKQTVVPFRNAIMLTISAGMASTLNFDRVVYGAHAGDHAIYPDCRIDFINAIRDMFKVADYNIIDLYTPYVKISKADIVKRGIELKVPYEDTWSCYKGEELACGKCGTCVERLEAFKLNNVKDVVKYK